MVQIVRILPTYHLADGTVRAMLNQATTSGTLIDAGIVVGCTALALAAAIWCLRRQAVTIGAL